MKALRCISSYCGVCTVSRKRRGRARQALLRWPMRAMPRVIGNPICMLPKPSTTQPTPLSNSRVIIKAKSTETMYWYHPWVIKKQGRHQCLIINFWIPRLTSTICIGSRVLIHLIPMIKWVEAKLNCRMLMIREIKIYWIRDGRLRNLIVKWKNL